MKVELYIFGETKNPAIQKEAQARWRILCTLKSGIIEKREGAVLLKNATIKKAVLAAFLEALNKFNKSAVIKIYISDDYVRAALINGWPKRWKDNNWHKIRLNGDIKHLELWQQVTEKLSNHAVSFAKETELKYKNFKEMEDY